MFNYILKRFLFLIPILIGLSLLIFVFLYLIPGDVARMIAGPSASKEVVDSITNEMGLNRPLPVQYFEFLTNFLTGDFGHSYQSGKAIIDEIPIVFKRTLQLTIIVQIISFIIGGIMGIISAVWRKSIWDRLIMAVSVSGLSLPLFWSALVIQLLFSIYLGWLPPSGYRSGFDLYIILPTLTLVLPNSGMLARVTRSAVIDVMNNDYIRTAKSKGLSNFWVITKHIVRNALIPMITMTGTNLSRMMGGVIMIEIIFTWPGMGKYVYDALLAKDFPALQTATMLIASLVIVINLFVDLTYGLIDPRIRYHN
ncbi:MAG: ABC transporter permease [Halanaerobiales bacterium]|nr:ABC transporter permease [Halanaerobiales bacterium]